MIAPRLSGVAWRLFTSILRSSIGAPAALLTRNGAMSGSNPICDGGIYGKAKVHVALQHPPVIGLLPSFSFFLSFFLSSECVLRQKL